MTDDMLTIAGQAFHSRLLVGTGKFASNAQMAAAIEASGADIVTVAIRRVDLNNPQDDMLNHVDRTRYQLLPNTSGARNADEAIRIARLTRAALNESWIKLEVVPDPRHLLPDGAETLRATEVLVGEGFTVLPYIQADPILARQLEEAGAATVMPLGAPIGTNRGLRTRDAVELIIEGAGIPGVVDAGLGVPSHAAEAMETGADAVLVNTAIAVARDPVGMAQAFKQGVEAGRTAWRAGYAAPTQQAAASSPLTGFLHE